jgi:hypothetical protein
MSVVEPVFGNIGTNKRLNRFSLRGKKKVQGAMAVVLLDTQHREVKKLR